MTWQICTWILSNRQMVLHDRQVCYTDHPTSFRVQTKLYETKMREPTYWLQKPYYSQLLAKYTSKWWCLVLNRRFFTLWVHMTTNDIFQKRCYFFSWNTSVAWPTKMTDSENVKETSIFIFRLCCSPLDPESNESCPHKQILLYRLEFTSIWNGSKVPNKICLDSVYRICSPKLKSRILHTSLINRV